MRRFEYVGGGSEKFWEIDTDGTSVTVRFGRLGTNGQTQAKQLGSIAEATAHEAKLVAEKVKKGYTETASGSSRAAVLVPPPVSSTAVIAPPVAAAPTPSTEGPTLDNVPVVASSPTVAEPVDEDGWVVPSVLLRQVHPIRGRSATKVSPSREPWAAVRAAIVKHRKRFDEVMAQHRDDTEFVASVHRYLDAEEAGGPVSAYDAGVAARALRHIGWSYGDPFVPLVDHWWSSYGPAFAADALCHLVSVDLPHRSPGTSPGLVAAGANDLRFHVEWPLVVRLRKLLAASSDADFDAARARLAERRAGSLRLRVVVSYLMPTEQGWVDDDIAVAPSFALLLASVTTPRQLDAVLGSWNAYWPLMNEHSLLSSVAAHVGPDAARWFTRVFDHVNTDANTRRRLVALLAAFPTDEAMNLLVERLDQKYVEAAVLEAAAAYPRRAMRVLSEHSLGSSGAVADAARKLLQGHVVTHPTLAEQFVDDPRLGSAIAAARRAAEPRAPFAPIEAVPAALVSPPWLSGARQQPVVVPGIVPPDAAITLAWLPGERDAVLGRAVPSWTLDPRRNWAGAVEQVLTGQTKLNTTTVAWGPAETVRPLLGVTTVDPYHAVAELERILARFDAEAVDLVWRCVKAGPIYYGAAALPLEGGAVAATMSELLSRSKAARAIARAWFDRHPTAAAVDLVPVAVGPTGRSRGHAEVAVRYLDRRGHRQALIAAARAHGDAAVTAVEQLLDADPLLELPARLPTTPAWLDPARLPSPLLKDRSAVLPVDAVGHLCTMLALSTADHTYAGVALTRAALDPATVAELAWSIFEAWRGAGYPNRDAWVLHALGAIGDDDTVRMLTPLIKAWPGESANARAVAALDVLSAIGTDVALMHLHNIAEKAKFRGLKSKAQEKIAEVAEGLGLTAGQLADRLVPDFGLAADGFLHLEYGPRRFRAGFDEQLRPVVLDEDGSRRKTLPAPNAKDDPQLAPAAYAAFSGLKKDVRTVAADQMRRLERAMVQTRRWTAAEHRALFVEHPLLCHVARRVVWGVFDGDAMTASFRVVEDRTFADARDETYELPEDATVGLAHPLHLAGDLNAWSEVFADYEILQPFAQLGRDVHRLTDAERAGTVIRRFDGVTVPTTRILGLSHRGWERGAVMDGGVSGVVWRPLAGGGSVVIDLDPGIIAGMATEFAEQKLSAVWVSSTRDVEWGNGQGEQPLSTLDDIAVSELLRDLESLRA